VVFVIIQHTNLQSRVPLFHHNVFFRLRLPFAVVSAQTFEYTAANLLDKAFESVMGFISVLPGAFSAYRYEAIAGVPLNVYFRLEDQDAATLSPGQANAYLAEDRLLGFEIVAKRGCKYVLHYNHQSRAFTDVPATIGMLVRQRRRWMNGSLFAQLMALGAWSRLISQTRHNIFRKIGFCLLFVYHVLAMGLSFLLLGNAYFGYALLFRVLSNQLTSMTGSADAGAVVNTAFTVMMWIFQLILLTLFVYSLGNRPEESETVWSVCVHLLGGFNTVSSALLIWMIRDWTTNWQIWTGGLTAFGAILVCALFQRRFANIASTLFQYIWQVPMYLFILPIYSLCNTNDVSWGTREAHATAQQAELKAKMDRNFREFRSRIVIMWILVNLLFSQFLDSFSAPTAQQQASGQNVNNNALTNYVIIIACVSAFMLGLRVIGCFIYVGLEWIKYANCMNKGPNKCCRKHAPQYSRAGRPTMFDGVLAGLGMKKTFSGYESNMGSMAGMAHHNNSMFNPSPPGGGGLPTFGQSSLSSASRSAAALAAIKEAGTEVDDDDSGSDTGPKEGASKVMSSPGFGGARTMYGSGGTEGDSKGTATPSTAANALNLYKSSPRSILKGSSGGSTTSLLRSASKKVGLSSDAGEDVATGLTAQTPNRMPSSKFAIPGSSRTLTSDPMANTYGSLAEGDNEDGADDEDGAGVEGGVGEYSEEDYYANIPEGYYLASDGNIYPLPAGGIEELEQYRDQLAAAAAAANGGIPEGDENEEEGDEDDNNVSADSTSINVMSADGKPSDGDEAVNSEAEDDSARSDGRSQMQRLDSLLRAQTFVATSASGAISKPSGKFVPPGGADTTATNAAAAPRRNSLVGASDQPS
jgi:cellulose synthase/poly-beta-1,6-N-acetylglucosamine synthase-like glycosyltransferase